MAKIVLATVGTTGDVVPYVALALGLMARGHQVQVVSHAMHGPRFTDRGINFVPERQTFDVKSVNAVFEEAGREKAPLRQLEIVLNRWFLGDSERKFETHLAVTKGADLLVSHCLDYFAQEAAIRNQIPWVSVSLHPHLVPTYEAPVYPLPRLGLWWTKMTWKGLYDLAQTINRKTYAVMKPLGIPPRSLGVAGAVSPLLHLLAASPALAHLRGDWPSHVKVTGAWLDQEPSYQPPPELAEFLERYPEPVMISFGSVGGGNAEATEQIILEAVRRVDRPALVQSGFAGLLAQGGSVGERVFRLSGYVPYGYLFRKASCVVHHAGAGTSTLACLSRAPSVAVPHVFDNYYWAGMLHERHAAPKPIFRPQLTGKNLAKSIETALRPEYRAAASALSPRIAEEHGVERAIELLEEVLSSGAPASPP